MKHAIKTKNFEACIMLMNTGVNIQFDCLWKASYTLNEFAMDLLAYTVINESENVHGIYRKLGVNIRDRSLLEGILSRVEGKAKQEHVDELKARIHALSREHKRMASSSSSSSSSSSASENPSSNENMRQLLANFLQTYDSFKEAGVLDAELGGLLTPENGPEDYKTKLIAQALREKNERACLIIASLGNTNELLDLDKLKMIGELLQGHAAPNDLDKLKLIELTLRKEKKEQKQAFSSSSSLASSSPNIGSVISLDSSSPPPLIDDLTPNEEEYVFVSFNTDSYSQLKPARLDLSSTSSPIGNSSSLSSESIESSLPRAEGTSKEELAPTVSYSSTDDSSSDDDEIDI